MSISITRTPAEISGAVRRRAPRRGSVGAISRFVGIIGIRAALLAALALLPLGSPALAGEEAADEFFEKQVRPILAERCQSCHDGEKPKGGLRLTSRDAILAGGDSGPAAEPGQPEESLLVQAIRYQDVPRMPPKAKLSDAEIDTLTRWVQEGLHWPGDAAPPPAPTSSAGEFVITDEQRQFWAFQPMGDPDPPPVEDPAWCANEIDRFILAGLEARGLKPARPADRRALIRRVAFDLTGLPPAPDEVEAFVNDPRPDAYERLVDRMLASPQYGVRWARHWLDVVRYADSLDTRGSGQPGDILDAWRYRDWVVDALNADLPYDRFVHLQIAGDALPPRDASEGAEGFNRAGTIASTMLAIGNWGNGDADKEKILTDIADDQVDVVSKAFLGLTISCARCHDHKFDPFSQADYYGLAGIFFSTHILPKLTPKGAGETIIRVPLASPAELARRAEREKRLAELEAELKATRAKHARALAESLAPEAGRYVLAAWDQRREEPGSDVAAFARERGLHPYALRQWIDALGGAGFTLLGEKQPTVGGVAGVSGWRLAPAGSSATANGTDQAQKILTFTLPPRSISVHPGPGSAAVIAWRSPIGGSVRISGRVADGDAACGDGFAWSLEHRSLAGSRTLARGELANGAAMALGQGEGADRLARVEVRPGDHVELLIHRRGEYSCDTTTVDLVVSSWDSAETWDLTRDCLADFTAANPHPDRAGRPGVWSFGDTARGAQPGSAADDAAWAAWRAAIEKGDDRPALEAAAEALGSALVRDPGASPFLVMNPADEAAFPEAARAAIRRVAEELDALRAAAPPPLEYANAAQEGGVPESPHAGIHDVRMHLRGRYDRLGELVPRRFPTILAVADPPKITNEGSGRKELAEWLTRPDHPLTARVMVNRIWQHHFGEGLVRTPSNFGKLGERPTHPELLDRLARRFLASGWSIKAMHRLILLSSTYQQSCEPEPDTLAADPDNRLWGRMNRRRLEAESLRDHLLAASGRLDPALGGPAVRDFAVPRRGLYVITIRSDRATFGALFDQADSTAPVAQRTVSTVAPQALFLLNNPFVLDQSRALAARLIAATPDVDARIDLAYRLLFARGPDATEVDTAKGLLEALRRDGATDDEAWEAYAQVVLCSNDFMYIE